MKKNLITAILGLVACQLAYGQVGEPRNDFAVGINGGYTMNQMFFNPTIKQGFKGAPTFGVTMRYTCEKYFKSLCAIQMELNYANLGWKEIIETSADQYSRDIHYLQVPILARMGWGYEDKGAMFYVVAGPQVAFYMGDKEHKSGEFSEETLNLRPGQIYQQYGLPVKNKFEYGITAGLGIEVNTPKAGHFLLEGRYYYGLSDVFGNSKKDTFGRSANGMIAVKVSYLFDIVKTKNKTQQQ